MRYVYYWSNILISASLFKYASKCHLEMVQWLWLYEYDINSIMVQASRPEYVKAVLVFKMTMLSILQLALPPKGNSCASPSEMAETVISYLEEKGYLHV